MEDNLKIIKTDRAIKKDQAETNFLRNEIISLREKVDRLQSLIEVTSIISSVLDLEELLSLVMEKAQSVMHAEASSVMLLNEAKQLLECEVALGEVGEQVKRKVQLKIGQGIAGWVAKTGKPLIVADVSKDSRFYAKSDELTGFRTHSILAAPLMVKKKIIGVAEVINPLDGRAFNEDDLDIFITFCRQVALAIENAKIHRYLIEKQKLEQQLESAYTIQQSFMPQSFPESTNGSFSVWAKNVPATSIGGDFYDFLEFNSDKLGMIIGDVSGKGIPAALFMARLVSDFRFYSSSDKEPGSILAEVNNYLVDRSRRGMFVTLNYLLLDIKTGCLIVTDGGHLPPIWFHKKRNQPELIRSATGIPLGIQKDISFNSTQIQLEHGDSIILYTDGVIEAKNCDGQQFSMNKLLDLINGKWDNPEQIVDKIIANTLTFSEGIPQHDDITVLGAIWH